ncbi:hypothetical protein DTO164E3_5562 [Paecilomyces variotii]|nr:hypothetical protein DTO164E3_5562 [Paecilomyces variotii]KAJ9198284.1 hypothetical protein DTO032I3_5523 [Paecilomyces variotii]KAJ9218564.1 hypothetical protein DTO169C6_9095 [Paecilomyces variotii]KAJ9279314.1 hypothetical protein DTO021D3_3770 [Paecilomyces variotii]KAJ9321050.1 hypothetical protein DTO027B3_7907 [Paecilomyces variotii]
MSTQSNQGDYRYIEECAERRSSLSEQSHTSENTVEYSIEDDSEAGLYLLHSDSSGSDTDGKAWNQSSTSIVRTLATFWSFALMGANDSAQGALMPYLETWYGLSYTTVSLIFLAPLAGSVIAAFLSSRIHFRLGQRGLAFIAGSCHITAYTITAFHPPYPVVVFAFMIVGLGNSLSDSAWNAWIGNMRSANQMLGLLHGFYGAGAMASPLIATTLVTTPGGKWYHFYYMMAAIAIIETATSVASFWKMDGQAYREANVGPPEPKDGNMGETLFDKKNRRVTWLCALFILGYDGIEVTLGGWIVTFMMRVRHADPFASGIVEMGFWLGSTVGSVALGFVTPRIGERLAVAIYLPTLIALQAIFWLVPEFYVSAVTVALQGFFLGPLYPAVVVAVTHLLPRHLHVDSIGFASAVGGCGAAGLPFVVGTLAQANGVKVFQPFVIAMLGAVLVIWLCLPLEPKKENKKPIEMQMA